MGMVTMGRDAPEVLSALLEGFLLGQSQASADTRRHLQARTTKAARGYRAYLRVRREQGMCAFTERVLVHVLYAFKSGYMRGAVGWLPVVGSEPWTPSA